MFRMKPQLDAFLRRAAFFVSATAAISASLIPHTTVDADIPPKVQSYELPFHVVVYFVVTLTAMVAFARRRRDSATRLDFLLAGALFGAVMEILQATLPGVGRTATLRDFFSNLLGAALAAAFVPSRWLPSRELHGETA